MKRKGFIYHKVYDFGNLYKAYLASKKGKRWKKEVIKFETNLGSNLYQIMDDLINKTYKIKPYYVFNIKEPKERIVMVPEFRDRIVHHSLCDNVLEPIFERHYIPFTFANRRGKGTHAALKVLKSQILKSWRESKLTGDCYILKCDISKYFYSINHEILKQKIKRLIKDKNLLWLIDTIIDSIPGDYGLPIGNLTSQLFANYYLSDMDHVIKEKLMIRKYVRYMDDFTLIHKDKEYLKYCKDYLSDYLKGIGLKFNNKTQVFPVRNGVDFLGFHTYITDNGKIIMKLRRSSKNNMIRKIKLFNKKYTAGEIDQDKIRRSISSWVGHAKHGNTYNLRSKILKYICLKKG